MSVNQGSRNKPGDGTPTRYALAAGAAAVALFLRWLLVPLLGEANPYHTVWAAVAFAAWYCGLWPSIFCAVVSVIGVWYWFVPPFDSFALRDTKNAVSGIVGFLVFSGIIIAFGESNRRSVARSKWAEGELRAARDELEIKVQERTEDLKQATESLRELTSRLQQMRDDERRRIAGELHDSVGQLVSVLAMNIAAVRRQSERLDETEARALAESTQVVDQISREIRTISHLLHPPLLDAAGLASALRWYADEFAERSKIKVELDIPEELSRLSEDMEIAIFRMVQECLTNIHRHSGSSAAGITVREREHELYVEVRDQGRGISPDKQAQLRSSGRTGVGFRGMRERLRQLGGALEIRSGDSGTVVSATVPFPSPAIASKQ
jgi:signal transduction histidine kinase